MNTHRAPHAPDQTDNGQPPEPVMAPLPLPNLFRHALDEILRDPFAVWVIGFACGLVVTFLAVEASITITDALFLSR